MRLFKTGMFGFLVAILAGMAGILLLTDDLETLPAGALMAFPVVPAIVLYALVDRFRPGSPWRHAGFMGTVLLALGYGALAYWHDAQRTYSDGGGEMALLLGLTIAIAAAFSCLSMFLKTRADKTPLAG